MGTGYKTKNTYDDYIYAQQQAAARAAQRDVLNAKIKNLQIQLSQYKAAVENYSDTKSKIGQVQSKLLNAYLTLVDASTNLKNYWNDNGKPLDNGAFSNVCSSITNEQANLNTVLNGIDSAISTLNTTMIPPTISQIETLSRQVAALNY